jgi:hypothetical protein
VAGQIQVDQEQEGQVVLILFFPQLHPLAVVVVETMALMTLD